MRQADRSRRTRRARAYPRPPQPHTQMAPIDNKSKSRSERAGLMFPVGRIDRKLHEGRYGARIGSGAPVFLAAVLEYIVAEVFELAGSAASKDHKVRITPRHIYLAIKSDEELRQLFKNVTIPGTGVKVGIHEFLTGNKGMKLDDEDEEMQGPTQEM